MVFARLERHLSSQLWFGRLSHALRRCRYRACWIDSQTGDNDSGDYAVPLLFGLHFLCIYEKADWLSEVLATAQGRAPPLVGVEVIQVLKLSRA